LQRFKNEHAEFVGKINKLRHDNIDKKYEDFDFMKEDSEQENEVIKINILNDEP
jgi:hypothetical protein